jgi:hypothetical protein
MKRRRLQLIIILGAVLLLGSNLLSLEKKFSLLLPSDLSGRGNILLLRLNITFLHLSSNIILSSLRKLAIIIKRQMTSPELIGIIGMFIHQDKIISLALTPLRITFIPQPPILLTAVEWPLCFG